MGASGQVVVVCQRGQKLSEGTAAWLRHDGIEAQTLEGGFEAWEKAGELLVRTDKLPPRDAQGRTVWVTRTRPKVDRIACPWLIRRFIDANAVFLFVMPSEVTAVAERFKATPFDIEGVFWSHRGETCTFDTMIEELGLKSDPLKQLANIVRGADTARPDLAPQSAGLLAASLGYSRMYRDDLPARGGHALTTPSIAGAATPARRPTTGPPQPRPEMNDSGIARAAAPPSAQGSSARGKPARGVLDMGACAALSFGGPAGQIAVMHRILVEEKRWISEARFLHALNYCMLLPGPEAQQLATYIGWLMHRTLGGIMAGVLFVLPGAVAIMALSYVYAGWGNVPIVAALFFGLKAAVLAIVVEAVLRIGKRVA